MSAQAVQHVSPQDNTAARLGTGPPVCKCHPRKKQGNDCGNLQRPCLSKMTLPGSGQQTCRINYGTESPKGSSCTQQQPFCLQNIVILLLITPRSYRKSFSLIFNLSIHQRGLIIKPDMPYFMLLMLQFSSKVAQRHIKHAERVTVFSPRAAQSREGTSRALT